MNMNDIMVIGIAGGTGSGKTTITNTLMQRFSGDVSVVHHDNYYKAHHDIPYEERCLLNYDHPDSFDTEMMVDHLSRLKAGKSVQCPIYDYTIHDRSDRTVTIEPNRVIIVEGIPSSKRRMLFIELFKFILSSFRFLRSLIGSP